MIGLLVLVHNKPGFNIWQSHGDFRWPHDWQSISTINDSNSAEPAMDVIAPHKSSRFVLVFCTWINVWVCGWVNAWIISTWVCAWILTLYYLKWLCVFTEVEYWLGTPFAGYIRIFICRYSISIVATKICTYVYHFGLSNRNFVNK